jgi:hypothetical protein
MRTFPGFSPSRCVSSFEQRALPPQFKDSTSKGSTCCSLTPSARNRSRSTCSKQQKRALCCALKLHRNQRTCHHLAVAPAAGCAVERQRLAHCLGQSALAYPRPLCQAPASCLGVPGASRLCVHSRAGALEPLGPSRTYAWGWEPSISCAARQQRCKSTCLLPPTPASHHQQAPTPLQPLQAGRTSASCRPSVVSMWCHSGWSRIELYRWMVE